MYGTWGSYQWSRGEIIVRTTPDGTFCPELGAASTCIRFIVSIGIEKNIVQPYKLRWEEKEFLVDSICALYLKDLLPNYQYQREIAHKLYPDRNIPEITPPALASFINEKDIIYTLPSAVADYVKTFPR